MEQANLQRNRGKKLKFSIDIRELVLVLGGFVAGVGLAALIIDHIRERTQRNPLNDGTTTQPNSENEDSQGAPEENHNRLVFFFFLLLLLQASPVTDSYPYIGTCRSPIRVRPTDPEGSEAGQPTPTSTNMDSDPGTSGLPAGSNHSETPDYDAVTLFRDFVGPGNPAYYALLLQRNLARLQALNAPIDGHSETQIPNESPNEPEGVPGPVLEDGVYMLTENGKNFYDVLYLVASSLNSDRLMILTVMILLMILAVAYLVFRVAMAYIRTCSPCDLHHLG